ncbi:uncharacterized protein [Procambarus clarkii]|uniref:uncharacterized protein n=1 Tax=Procambarus clarkii TaxID=6728 RepID=UPI00374485F6
MCLCSLSTTAHGAVTGSTNAHGAVTGSTNAHGAVMGSTNAHGAVMGSTNAHGAVMGSTNAHGAVMGSTNAHGAVMGSTNAHGAYRKNLLDKLPGVQQQDDINQTREKDGQTAYSLTVRRYAKPPEATTPPNKPSNTSSASANGLGNTRVKTPGPGPTANATTDPDHGALSTLPETAATLPFDVEEVLVWPPTSPKVQPIQKPLPSPLTPEVARDHGRAELASTPKERGFISSALRDLCDLAKQEDPDPTS